MFDMFKGRPKDVKGIRNAILQFIKEQLQKTEGGEGANIKALNLYITCSAADKHLYQAALFTSEEGRFKEEEVQKIADDYAIDLPAGWLLEVSFETTAPEGAIKATDVDAALFISTGKKPSLQAQTTAFLIVLNGEAEKKQYTLQPSKQKITIGREKKAQTADGFYRENIIFFPGESTSESNRSVSRQHAHIEWDEESGQFYLYADEGGIPPLNKTKVRSAVGTIEKIQACEIGHRLKEGDQVMLGESAVIKFTYNASANS